jgi:hypothetical protein
MSGTESKNQVRSVQREVTGVTMDNWIRELYNINLMDDNTLSTVYDEVRYHGFNRDSVLAKFYERVNDPTDAVKLIILCAIRGPNKAHELSRTLGLSKYGIQLKGAKGQDDISYNRITAVTADVAAYYLKRLNVPKRINCECPAWLQFPSAGSIALPPTLREQHIEFSKIFSEKALNSSHDEGIYNQMILNAYYNPILRLF